MVVAVEVTVTQVSVVAFLGALGGKIAVVVLVVVVVAVSFAVAVFCFSPVSGRFRVLLRALRG
jgi:hypothetical protein